MRTQQFTISILVSLGLLGAVALGFTACVGGGGDKPIVGGNGNGMRIVGGNTSSGGRTVHACKYSVSGVELCQEYSWSGGRPSGVPSCATIGAQIGAQAEQVNQCPRSGPATSVSCTVTVSGSRHGTFHYGLPSSSVSTQRAGCAAGGGTFTVLSSSNGDDGGGDSSTTFPRATVLRNAPQESGRDIPGIEIAGAGTTTRLFARNTSGSTYTISQGTWYEPKDGNAQRMIVTQTVRVPTGTVATIPAACMQRSKPAPASGLRFFSQYKSIRSGIQTCQRNCLSGSSSSIQSCVWACETAPSTITFSVEDACADGTGIRYKFFGYRPDRYTVGQSVRVWPSRSTHWTLTGFGDENSHRLTCTPGHHICFGGEAADSSRRTWGVGFNDNASSSDYFCGTCPSSGNRDESTRLVCR